MKKILLLFMAVLTLGVTAHAADGDKFTVDNLKYMVTSEENKAVSLVGYENNPESELVIPQVVINGDMRYQVISIGLSAFNKCSSLISVTIPNSVTEIGSRAFNYCSSLTSVTIPNSVTEIGSEAFNFCSSLPSVTIPGSVTEIGSGSFNYCRSLKEILVEDWNKDFTSIDGVLYSKDVTTLVRHPQGKKSADYVIPSSVTEIGNSAFFWCDTMTSVTIPNSVTKIGSRAFYSCSGLTSVTIPNSVTEIGSEAFNSCSGLTSVTIPSSVTEISSRTFSLCSSLTSVTIPNSVTEIGSEAFTLCSSLPSVTIPNSVTEIGSKAFSFCSSLTSVTIPNSVTEISSAAFLQCHGLTSVTIPNSVTEIGSKAFLLCEKLTTVYCYAVNPPVLGNDVFKDVSLSDASLHVVKGYASAYEEAEVWKDFFVIADLERQVGVEGIETDGNDAPAEYFNHQGMRVANPENGIYIKRQGGKTTKVLVK